MEKYKALILDDEIENIKILKIYLKKFFPQIEIVAEAKSVCEGVQMYLKTEPDILLLDVGLGNDDAFSFIDSIGKSNSEIIFISSSSSYGVKAVNYNITGYVLKPIDTDKLKKAVNKAIFNLETKRNEDKIEKIKLDYPTVLAVPSIQKVEVILVESVEFLEADGKYTIFNLTSSDKKIASRNLGEYEKILDPKLFFRIHHRFLVNTNKINNIHKTDGYYCELESSKTLPIAKRRQELLNKFLKLK